MGSGASSDKNFLGAEKEHDAARAKVWSSRPGSFALDIHDLSGVAYQVRVNESDTVETLKLKVQGVDGPWWRRQRLYTVDGSSVIEGTMADNALTGSRTSFAIV